MLSRRIITICLLISVVSVYFYLVDKQHGFVWPLGIGVLLAISAYIFQHQINWWWYDRYPPQLHPQMQKMFLHTGKFYQSLDETTRKKFDTRVRLFVESKEFIAQGFDEVAEDIKHMVAYYAVMLTLDKEDYLFDAYRRVVIYLHPFLSPHFPDHVHTYEIEHEDGTLILALEQLSAGFFNPSKFYQTGLHIFAEILSTQEQIKVSEPEEAWKTLHLVSNWSKEEIENFTGMPQQSPAPVMLHHWIMFPEKLLATDLAMHRTIEAWLR